MKCLIIHWAITPNKDKNQKFSRTLISGSNEKQAAVEQIFSIPWHPPSYI